MDQQSGLELHKLCSWQSAGKTEVHPASVGQWAESESRTTIHREMKQQAKQEWVNVLVTNKPRLSVDSILHIRDSFE